MKFNLTNKIFKIIDMIVSAPTHIHSIKLFRKIVYGWYLLNIIILFPVSSEFWGRNSFVPKIDATTISNYPFTNILSITKYQDLYLYFIVLLIILLILGICCIYPQIVSILIYFVSINLDNKAYVILDGGNNLMQLMLIYLIFMNPNSSEKLPYSLKYLSNSFSNLGFYMARLQLVFVYVVSGLGKVTGTLWQNGTALYYTLNVDEYTHPIAKEIVASSPLFTVLGTYLTLFYQLGFPWLVWNTKIRPYLLFVGMMIHLQIAFVMGLFMFGLAIACSYFIFTPDNVAIKILEYPKKGWLRLNQNFSKKQFTA